MLVESVRMVVRMDTLENFVMIVRYRNSIMSIKPFQRIIVLKLSILYLLSMHTLACIDGYYGTNCSKECHLNCKTCRHTDGLCTCTSGWIGPSCDIGINYFKNKISKQWLYSISYLKDNI